MHLRHPGLLLLQLYRGRRRSHRRRCRRRRGCRRWRRCRFRRSRRPRSNSLAALMKLRWYW